MRPHITLEEHKNDVVAIAMAGGDPTDIYPVAEYCLPGEHQRIMKWIALFREFWFRGISGSIGPTQEASLLPAEISLRWRNGYVACRHVFLCMNETLVMPDPERVKDWEHHFLHYGVD